MKVFLHGLESSSRGAKALFLQGMFPDMTVPDFSGTLPERMEHLHAVLAGQKNITLIGSSFGGLMATIFAMAYPEMVVRLILLAPALNFPEFRGYRHRMIGTPAMVIIGSHDEVTPPGIVVPLARKIFSSLQYREVDDDHMLARTFRKFPWNKMLGRVG